MIPLSFMFSVMLLGPGQLPAEDAIKPADYAACGHTSFYLICRLLDVSMHWDEAKALIGPAAADGTHSFEDIARAGRAVGLHPVGLKTNTANLRKLQTPAIVQVRDYRRVDTPFHLVVILRFEADSVILLDPPMPAYSMPSDMFAEIWTGNVLVFAHDAADAKNLLWGGWARRYRWHALGSVAGVLLLATVIFVWRRFTLPSFAVGRNLGSNAGSRKPVRTIATATLLIAAAVAGVYFALPNARVAEAQCELLVPETTLGELSPGVSQTLVTIRNSGSAPLSISAVRSSCTCAVPKYPAFIEPGATGTIQVDLSVQAGPQRAYLIIETNDPAGPKRANLLWHGKGRPVLHPGRVAAVNVPADRPFARTIKLIYPGGRTAHRPILETATSDHQAVHVRVGKDDPIAAPTDADLTNIRAFGELELLLTVTPPSLSCRVDASCILTVRLGHEKHRFRLPVSIDFLGGEVMPAAAGVVFSALSNKELVGQVRDLQVSAHTDGGEFEITGLPEWLAVTQTPTGRFVRLLRLTLTRPPGHARRQHVIFVGRKNQPATRVPIVVHVVSSQMPNANDVGTNHEIARSKRSYVD